MKSKAFYALLPFLVAVLLRLYPYALTGLPFSVDSWFPIRNTELLLEKTPVDLGNDQVFDSYNNYWPANTLFGAVVSEVTGLQPLQAMAIFIPMAGATSILIFYAIVKSIYDFKTAFIASLIFATGFTHAIFTAGVTKETFANPLYLLLILVFLHPTIKGWRRITLFSVASLTLVMAHHYTTLVGISILFWTASAELIKNERTGHKQEKHHFLLISLLATFAALYYMFYAFKGFKFTVSITDLISAVSYQIIAFALATYLTFKPSVYPRKRNIVTGLGAAIVAFLITFLATRKPLVPGAPILPYRYLIYSLPFILASPLITIGRHYREGDNPPVAPLFWLASILGVEAYAIFSNSPIGLTLAYRTVNFLWPPLAVLCAAGIKRLYKTAEKLNTEKLIKLSTITVISAILASNAYTVYAAVSLQERYIGYFWLYKPEEYAAAAWTATTIKSQVVTGDVKVFYMLKGYFDVDGNVFEGLRYLMEEASEPEILFVYDQMLENGYVVYGGQSVDLPEDWTEKLHDLNLIYSNGVVNIFCGGQTP